MMQRVFFGHHKCASTWMSRIFYAIQKRTGFTISYGTNAEAELVIVPNANPESFAQLHPSQNLRGIHLIRDPRDVIVSGYFSHRNTHRLGDWENLKIHRQALQAVDMEQGLFLEMDFSGHFLKNDMYRWEYGANPDILELKYEEVIAPDYDFTPIFKHLELYAPNQTIHLKKYLNKFNNKKIWFWRYPNIGLNDTDIQAIIQENSFKNLSKGRMQGAENIQSHYRKGVAGDWKNYFTEGHTAYFEKSFGDILEKLGYSSE